MSSAAFENAPVFADGVMTVPALEAQHLSLSWDGSHVVVADANITVGTGETVCMVGRSGCGKTTILHALAGLTQPMEGRVLLHGKDVTGTPGHVSYMFQKDLLIPSKRVLDNVCLPLTLKGMSKAVAHKQARPLLGRFGLADTEDKWPSELSGGMRQRAAFLRTYLMGNDVMLLDEPFSALDAITRKDLREWFVSASRELGVASLMITHDVDEAVAVASKVYVLGGNPSAGKPSHIVGEVLVQRETGSSDVDFELTSAFLEAKRAVLALLNR
ncbi:ATP-binding cassette domain-containing protein [Atopobium sp. oral taxon 810]|uniref:ABC transporter ATP-binding protein n=1 Tax=Atopobium sp. oral taxon 810 TaxID=712158 RepID=UPI0003985B58|nr:ATP-binding cassette domain-containing protein [Atopobium sp. oral taxon 810]ERI06176.1 ABC transporter, ATP-binding protein [Atopobium sp. oral taxon 810 str. F0209]